MPVRPTRIGKGDPLATGLSSTGTVAGTDVDWPTSAGDVVAALDDLIDVNAPTPSDGDVLTWDIGASEWVPAASATGDVATDAIWDAKGDLAVGSNANAAMRLAVGSNSYVLTADSTAALGVKWAAATTGGDVAIVYVFDGGGAAIASNVKGDLSIPFGCTITGSRLLGDQTGSIVIDVWKDAYASYPPTVADTITASAKPTLSSAVKSDDTTLTGWTKTIAAGDTLRFNVDSCATITRATLTLTATRT